MKRKFELMAIISPAITDKEIEARIHELKELLGTEIVFEERWGMRPTAFKIKFQSKGYYVVFNFMLESDLVKELEANLRLIPDVIRTLLIQVPDDYKPITYKEVCDGLEKMMKQKTEKRFGGKPMLKKAEPEIKAAVAPIAPVKKELKGEEIVKPEPSRPAPSAEPKKEEKKKSFDQKLEDILSDADLGL